MQAYNFHNAEYFFFLIFLCTSSTSLAFISPFYFRTKPYMTMTALEQRSPDVIERELPKIESVKTSGNIPKEQPLNILDIITIPDSLGKYFGQMPRAANEISQANDFQNLLTRSHQQSLERQAEKITAATARPSRRRYDHNCFFTPVNCRPWI
ncbi:hypothetical protein DdX_13760 [Ditylenchus destructor]|uniref:Uncharacterized protein n=1 Tax=Ditylenchus destructor TaxID=166010 RepID=A0AAD4MYF1_9BILA|nr:hypothetical protein DdX_13760 [Ditylenchus destructor]